MENIGLSEGQSLFNVVVFAYFFICRGKTQRFFLYIIYNKIMVFVHFVHDGKDIEAFDFTS